MNIIQVMENFGETSEQCCEKKCVPQQLIKVNT